MSSLISFFCLFVCFKTLSYYNTHFPWSHIWKSITFFISDLWKNLTKQTNLPFYSFTHFILGFIRAWFWTVYFSLFLHVRIFFKIRQGTFCCFITVSTPNKQKTPTFRSSFTLLRTYFTNFTSGIKGEVAVKQTLAKEKRTKQQLLLIWTTYSGHF